MDYLSIATEALEREAPEDLSHLSDLAFPAEPYEGALADYLFPFQQAGVQYAMKARQVMIGDDMGLGKTPQAIAVLLNDGAADYELPSLVLCPPSLTANWRREVEALSDLSVYVAKGLEPTAADLREAMAHDVVVAGYSVLRTERVTRTVKGEAETITVPQGWARLLRGNIDALVLDEVHYCKTYDAQRSEAADILAEDLRGRDALIIELTGTPILNRPKEGAHPIKIIGRLPDTGFHSTFNWLKYYCNGRHNGYGWDFGGASNISALNERMRASFYVRRTKDDPEVLKQIGMENNKRPPVKVHMDLNGHLAEYNRAAEDIIAFAREHGGAEAAWSAERAEVLVRLNTLRRLAGKAKIEASVEWVNDWLDQNPGRKIVVFAVHRDVQAALAKAFDCPALVGGMDPEDVEEAKAEFNEGEARVIVLSLLAHREGHTLVAGGACSDVVFVEQGWTPAEHDQAEDRVNRIGQTEVVTPWYLLGPEIDHALRDLIEAKGVVTDAFANGVDAAYDEAVAQAAFFRLTA